MASSPILLSRLPKRCSNTMWQRLLIFLLVSTASLRVSAQCECLWQGSFVDVQHMADLIIAGSVIDGKGNSIDLRVDSTLRGTPASDTVRVWLHTANYCRPDAALFPIDSSWIMALYRIDQLMPGGFNPSTPNVSYGRVGDYFLSSCGGYWLELKGGYASGALIASPRWVREPKMTPVLLELIAAYVAGETDADTLLQASREDPALRELKLDTRAFLRGDEP